MRLLIQLVARLVGVVLLCLACAVGWVMVDAHRSIGAETAATADRVSRDLGALYWREIMWKSGVSKNPLLPSPDWQTLRVAQVVSPGVCVTFTAGDAPSRKLCGQEEGVGRAAPDWFARLYDMAFDARQPETRPLTVRNRDFGTIAAEAVPAAALRQAWAQMVVVASVAAAMAAGIAILAALTIGHALAPARAIVEGLKRIGLGQHDVRLPAFRAAEFREIARAANELAARLSDTAAERAALTKRLFEVQEEERRALARDLHDEFGQCLTATAALAASIEAGAAEDRPDLVEDARSIARVQARMMETLKGALARLRSQEIEEIGLQASLEKLVSGWNAQGAGPARARYRLDVEGEIAALPAQTAVGLYRIAQECLTNAARHGRPSDVRLSIHRLAAANDQVSLVVEDDGGGDPGAVEARAGGGVTGIRERVQALGGSLSIGSGERGRGVRVAALIPLSVPLPLPHLRPHPPLAAAA